VHLKIFGNSIKNDIDEGIKIEYGKCFCLLPFRSHCLVFLSVIQKKKVKIRETLIVLILYGYKLWSVRLGKKKH